MITMIIGSINGEWLKIVASTSLGLIAGLLAEPIKRGITDRSLGSEISKAIKKDLKQLRSLIPVYRLNRYSGDHISSLIELPAYKHYWTANKPCFFRSPHLGILHLYCRLILIRSSEIKSGACTKLDGLTSIAEHVTLALKSRESTLFESLRSRYRIWRNDRKYKFEGPVFWDKDGPHEKFAFLDSDGNVIPEGEGAVNPRTK